MVTGTYVSGVGEGAWYVRKYASLIAEKLGFTPFEGTINMEVAAFPRLPEDMRITIRPTQEGLFPIDCYHVLINNTYKGAIVVPHKTVHKATIELIAPERIPLQLGDEITCELV